MTTQRQKLTYERLRFFFEAYDLPHCRAELDRAWHKIKADSRPARVARQGSGERKRPFVGVEIQKPERV